MSDQSSDFKTDSIAEHGHELTGLFRHWCRDWDFMTIDETCPEFESCLCFPKAITARPDDATPDIERIETLDAAIQVAKGYAS